MRLRLHHILFVCFALVSTMPLTAFGSWVGHLVHSDELAARQSRLRNSPG